MKMGGFGLATINRRQRNSTTHVLLYHSTYADVPSEIEQNLHNVHPDVLFEQLTWLKKHFDIVDVDDLFEGNLDGHGQVAITFDDGYKSVFSNALPVLETLDVPCTVFLNGASLNGKAFWRDKSRYVINQELVPAFLSHSRSFAATHGLTNDNFYRATKRPRVNSKKFENELDTFLESQGIEPDTIDYCVNDVDMLVNHPLVTYGNHTFHHYVLSSLSQHEQDEEIGSNHRLLAQLSRKVSRVFSVPFGGTDDLNEDTLKILAKYGYRGFLYSRGALNAARSHGKQRIGGLEYRERYMVHPTMIGFQKQIFKLWIKGSKLMRR